MPSSFATRAIGRDVSITILTASSLNSDEKLFFGRGNYFTFPEVHPNGWTVRKLRGTPEGLAAPAAGSGRQAGRSAAGVVVLAGGPGVKDALGADGQQAGEPEHEGGQAREPGP